jgi:alpha-tubulin suppressor-like RCC1 family protein
MADGTLRIHMRGSEYRPEPLRDIRVFIPSPALSVLTRVTPTLGAAEAARDVADTFAVGMAHTVTLKAGAVHTEGANDCGQCDLRAVGEALRVAAGPYHSAAVLLDGTLALAGQNTDGQADADALNRELDPLSAATGETQEGRGQGTSQRLYSWERVACGFAHTAAIRSDGRVYAVGANPDGRCDTRQWRDVTHLACGMRHTLAVTADGSCVATGDNGYGQCDVADWQDVIMVAAGEFHSVGLRADGRVAAAGDNRKGQCRVEDLRDVISVACLPEATLCVHADGRVTLRGGSTEHSEAVAALREVIALRTCEHRLAALTADRRLILI